MSTKDQFDELLETESLRTRPDTDIRAVYRGYAVGNALSLWRKFTGASETEEAVQLQAEKLYELLKLPRYVDVTEPGTREGFEWVRKQMRDSFGVK
jgi:hypothetical protein